MSCKSKANLVRMNEESGISQVTRPFPSFKQRAEIELQCRALETSIFIWHSNKPLSDCFIVQYSCRAFFHPTTPPPPQTDTLTILRTLHPLLGHCSAVVSNWEEISDDLVTCHLFESFYEWNCFCIHACRRRKYSESWSELHTLLDFRRNHNSKLRAIIHLGGHPDANKAPAGDYCFGVAHWGEWPRSCWSAKRTMPRGLEKAEEPQPPVPIRLRVDNCTGLWGSHPNKTKRGRGGKRQGQGHSKPLTESRLMTLDKLRLLHRLLTPNIRWGRFFKAPTLSKVWFKLL